MKQLVASRRKEVWVYNGPRKSHLIGYGWVGDQNERKMTLLSNYKAIGKKVILFTHIRIYMSLHRAASVVRPEPYSRSCLPLTSQVRKCVRATAHWSYSYLRTICPSLSLAYFSYVQCRRTAVHRWGESQSRTRGEAERCIVFTGVVGFPHLARLVHVCR